MTRRFQPFRPVGRSLKNPPGRHERIRGRELQRIRKQVMQEQPLCPDCEKEGLTVPWYEDGHLDHIKPLAEGGTNDRSNLQGLCGRHHDQKTRAENRKRSAGG